MIRILDLIVGYIIGNKDARNWCVKQIGKASLVVDRELKTFMNSDKKTNTEREEDKCQEVSKK